MCWTSSRVGHHHMQTNNVNKTRAPHKQLEAKTNRTSLPFGNIKRTSQHDTQNVKTHNRTTVDQHGSHQKRE